MNFYLLAAVLAIWLAVVSYAMPLTTLITGRPIEFAIVLVMFGLVGLVIHVADSKEENPELADEKAEIPTGSPLAEDTMAEVVAQHGNVAFPLHDTPLPAGIGG